MFERLRVSPERAEKIVAEIYDGSEPQSRFFILLMTSAMIACFGLVANSTAVIIGAMLVSPLMTPIFGIALGLLRGDNRLFLRGLMAELTGVVLAVLSAFVFGMLDLTVEPTPEMLARTQPNLLDLFVAIFAGFAGAFAYLNERVSPALPGVAIAVAIVPPLSTVGLCLALGAYAGAAGAMLLFVANLVSILLVASLMFLLGGLAIDTKGKSWAWLVTKFLPSIVGFVAIAVVLTNSLLGILQERRLSSQIRQELMQQLAKMDDYQLVKAEHHQGRERLQVLASIRGPESLEPMFVQRIQNRLTNAVGMPTDLVVRTRLAKDVSPTGSNLRATKPDLNGTLLTEDTSEVADKLRLASQVLYEYFQNEPGFQLDLVEYGIQGDGKPAIIARIKLFRGLVPSEVQEIETLTKHRLHMPDLHLALQYARTDVWYRGREWDFLWDNVRDLSTEERDQIPNWRSLVAKEIDGATDCRVTGVHFNQKDDVLRILAQVVGPTSPKPEEIESTQARLSAALDRDIQFQVRYQADYVVTPAGFSSYREIITPELPRQREGFQAFSRIQKTR